MGAGLVGGAKGQRGLADAGELNDRGNQDGSPGRARAQRVQQVRQNAGIMVHEGHTSWLDVPAEKVIIEARVESSDEDEIKMRQTEEANAIMAALREHGYAPPRPEDWVEGGFGDGDESATSRIDNVVVNDDTADDATQES